jgi:pimeloyl-ACP methyl ester carboxylesterase
VFPPVRAMSPDHASPGAPSPAGRLGCVSLELPELRTADVDGPVRYREWDGPEQTTFVLVHGLGGSHLNWVQVAPGLSGLGRVLAIDLPGFGYSPSAGRGSGLMDERRVLSGLIEELGSGQIVVCGNSMGGALGILQAAIEPASVSGLVLTCSIFPWTRGGWPHPAVLGAFAMYDVPAIGDRLVRARMRRLSPERTVRLAFAMIAADPRRIPAEIVRLNVDLLRERQSDPDAARAFLEAARSMLRLGRRPDVARRALEAVKCPVLVLHGRRDRFVPAAFAEAVLARHPDWRGRIFPDVGHAPQMEMPGRWLVEVADWFSDTLG